MKGRPSSSPSKSLGAPLLAAAARPSKPWASMRPETRGSGIATGICAILSRRSSWHSLCLEDSN